VIGVLSARFPAAAIGRVLRWRPGSDKFRFLAAILLGLTAAYGATYLAVAVGRGWPQGFGDSSALWMWGRFAIDHPGVSIYDPAILHAAQLGYGMDPGASYRFGYPPSVLLLLWPLAQLSGPVALAVLLVATLPLYLWATVGADWRSPALAAALAAPTTAIVMVAGQSSFLATALLVGGLRLAAARPVAGGALLGLLTYKPQLGLLVPVALVAARLWRTLAAAAATALLLVIVTSLIFGPAMWPAWAATLPGFSREMAADGGGIMHLMPTIIATLSQLGVPPATAQLAQAAAAAMTAALIWALFRSGTGPVAAAGLLVATPLATPYGFVYDMPIVTTAMIWLVAERHRAGAAFSTGEVLVLMLALLAPMTLTAAYSPFPLGAPSLILLLGIIARRHWRLGAQLAPSPRLSPAGN
jgi:hypothetical protein